LNAEIVDLAARLWRARRFFLNPEFDCCRHDCPVQP
jgi:hypothetical protein